VSASSHTPTTGSPRPATFHLLAAKLEHSYGKIKGADVISAKAQAILNQATDSRLGSSSGEGWPRRNGVEAAHRHGGGSCCCSLEAATSM